MRIPFSIPAIALVGVLAFGACSSRDSNEEAGRVRVLTNQEILALLTNSTGKVTVANFWATWCIPCLEEMPHLIRFYREYEPKGVRFVSVSLDDPEEPEKALIPFLEKMEVPFPVYVPGLHEQPEGLIMPIDSDWDGVLPATFVFDSAGKLHHSWLHETEFSELVEVVDPLLEET